VICKGCEQRRTRLKAAFGSILKGMKMSGLYPQQSRSGEWEVVNGNGVVKASGFDNRAEAEEYVAAIKKVQPKPLTK
jgi:hypothetical protein